MRLCRVVHLAHSLPDESEVDVAPAGNGHLVSGPSRALAARARAALRSFLFVPATRLCLLAVLCGLVARCNVWSCSTLQHVALQHVATCGPAARCNMWPCSTLQRVALQHVATCGPAARCNIRQTAGHRCAGPLPRKIVFFYDSSLPFTPFPHPLASPLFPNPSCALSAPRQRQWRQRRLRKAGAEWEVRCAPASAAA